LTTGRCSRSHGDGGQTRHSRVAGCDAARGIKATMTAATTLVAALAMIGNS
jgi:hypothetical protein